MPKTPLVYFILVGNTVEHLEFKVTCAIKDWYKPLGWAQFCIGSDGKSYWQQTMLK